KGPIWQQSSFGIERAQAQRRTSLWSSLRQPLSPDRARRVHGQLQLRALVRLAKRIAVDGLPFGIQKLVGFAPACARASHDLDLSTTSRWWPISRTVSTCSITGERWPKASPVRS